MRIVSSKQKELVSLSHKSTFSFLFLYPMFGVHREIRMPLARQKGMFETDDFTFKKSLKERLIYDITRPFVLYLHTVIFGGKVVSPVTWR